MSKKTFFLANWRNKSYINLSNAERKPTGEKKKERIKDLFWKWKGCLLQGFLWLGIWTIFINNFGRWKKEYSCNVFRQHQPGWGSQALWMKNLKDWKQFKKVKKDWKLPWWAEEKNWGKNKKRFGKERCRTLPQGIINCVHIRKRALLAKQSLNRRHWITNWMWLKNPTLWKVNHILGYMAELL